MIYNTQATVTKAARRNRPERRNVQSGHVKQQTGNPLLKKKKKNLKRKIKTTQCSGEPPFSSSTWSA